MTFEKSRNFLLRYQIWAVIDEIVAADGDRTPHDKRSIDWLVDSYLGRSRTPESHCRLIPHPAEKNPKGKLKERYLRHVSRSDITGILAGHAEWLVAQHLSSSSTSVRKLDVGSLIGFCKEVKALRKDARRNGVRWGLPYGVEVDQDKHINLAQFGDSAETWDRRFKTALKPKSKPKPKPPPRQQSPQPDPSRSLANTYVYDSDFSEASTSSAYDTDEEIGDKKKIVPSFCLYPPTIPPGRFEWKCPGCEYRVDLLELAIGGNRPAGSKVWKYPKEDHVQLYLKKVVSQHYNQQHIRMLQAGGMEVM